MMRLSFFPDRTRFSISFLFVWSLVAAKDGSGLRNKFPKALKPVDALSFAHLALGSRVKFEPDHFRSLETLVTCSDQPSW